MNGLKSIFDNNKTNLMNKWHHYFEIYENHFSKFRDRKIVLLEIGVFQGGSINLWKQYFGDKVEIYAIDINPLCKSFEQENVKIFIGSQEDKSFLNSVLQSMPNPDIIIDDGGHSMTQQITSFEMLFPFLKTNGVYFLEDLHSSYWYNYGGGFKRSTTFIEYSKHFIDKLHAWHSESDRLKPDYFTRNIYALHYYDSILVIDKKDISPPKAEMSGKYIFSPAEYNENFSSSKKNSFLAKLIHRIRYKIYKLRFG